VTRLGGDRIGKGPRLGRTSVDLALAWVDAGTCRLGMEDVALSEAAGRVLGEDICAGGPIPPRDCAALDGFAVRARDSLGASSYNPLSLPLIAVAAGDALPDGTDAVVPLEHGQPDEPGRVELVQTTAPSDNVDRQGAVAAAGAILARAGTRLAPHHIGLLAGGGFVRASIVRHPRVRIIVAGSIRSSPAGDSNRPMVCAAVHRDGGIVAEPVAIERDRSALATMIATGGADIVLVIGGTGPGCDDVAAPALAATGELAIHGIALHPGDTSGLGRTAAGVPVVLLPGAPAACLWSYELFAGRAIRRLGGHDPQLPYRSATMTTARKLVSAIGMTEICPVRWRPDGGVEPLASFAETGLMAAVGADGFVIVPEASEGYRQGAAVTVYSWEYGDRRGGTDAER
jgi:molybdopterin molybdotransferase